MDINQKLSKHFSLWECIRSETANRYNIDNMPPIEYIPKLKILCEKILEPPRLYFNTPFRPNSVYRCIELNRKIGSKDTSQHIKAEAVDFEIPGINNYDLAVWMKNHINSFDQIILECYKIGQPNSGWVHVSYKEDENKNRNNVLTYTGGQYISGLIKN
jgi:hypothetical protein